ncbi:Phospholipase A I [Exaiptasia diaphana]|nr:Phospholipase A I [Exaiptasia diaphana]
MKQETENEILMIDKWPSKRFKKIAEDDGRALQLFNVDDTTKTIFKTEELKFLRLENCNVYGYLLHNQLHNDFWKSIDSLSIVSCGLYYVPDVILTRMWSLVKLDLSHNKIKTIPKNIGQIKFLRYLDISYNNISEGIDNLLQMQTLVKLNLRGNDSIKLNEDHLQQEINLMKLEISDDVLEETFMMTEEMSSKLENIIVTLPENDFVIKYSLERAPIIEDMRKNRQCYNMTSNPKGVVAIIDTTADGNKYENLERVFKEIGYNVEKVPQDNVSTIKSLEKTLSDLFRGYDSAILIMTAEGYIDGLYLGDELVDIDKIYKCLPKNGLKGKPKLIFLQVDSIAKNPDYIYKPSRAFTYPDTFIAYTVFYEFQGANQFFETLVEVFSNYAWEEDFLSLMKCVKYELSRKFRNKEYEHFYAPKIGGLKKKLYFFPGYYDNRVRITNIVCMEIFRRIQRFGGESQKF